VNQDCAGEEGRIIRSLKERTEEEMMDTLTIAMIIAVTWMVGLAMILALCRAAGRGDAAYEHICATVPVTTEERHFVA
jgi:hypothetical protein